MIGSGFGEQASSAPHAELLRRTSERQGQLPHSAEGLGWSCGYCGVGGIGQVGFVRDNELYLRFVGGRGVLNRCGLVGTPNPTGEKWVEKCPLKCWLGRAWVDSYFRRVPLFFVDGLSC